MILAVPFSVVTNGACIRLATPDRIRILSLSIPGGQGSTKRQVIDTDLAET